MEAQIFMFEKNDEGEIPIEAPIEQPPAQVIEESAPVE